ncbi:MAG: hypothetical protein VXV96_03080 [Bdellovibrionota bacterium]|nr:hypothetical protein [Bdellovibrionota bacterium]
MKNLSLLFLLAAFTVSSWASNSTRFLEFTETEKAQKSVKFDEVLGNDPYFEIEEVTVTDLDEEVSPFIAEEETFSPHKNFKTISPEAFAKDLGTWIMNAEKLIAFGTKVWEIIKKGKPVTNINMGQPISVLPETEDARFAFTQMGGWAAPRARKYRVAYKNGFGMNVISFDYIVYFQYGGNYEGKGQYLTGVTVRAASVAVSWGFEFNASSGLETISNRGSVANPIAGATVKIDYKASSVFREISSSESFHVAGNGEIIKL